MLGCGGETRAGSNQERMRITFLGGADEIGASCAVLDLEEHRFLIDCGQRMNAPAANSYLISLSLKLVRRSMRSFSRTPTPITSAPSLHSSHFSRRLSHPWH